MAESSKAHKNFLRELTNPDRALLDIVAVHGLNAMNEDHHAYLTWTASNKKMWLSDPDFLPAKIPYARILLYGYNSNLAFEASAAGIDEHADNLLNRLKLKRKGSMQRPIIFICYSLGGIVVKKALIIAKLDNTYTSIHSSSYGIVFFGTPHRGGDFKSLGEIASSIAEVSLKSPGNTLVESLREGSVFADITAQYFRHQLGDYRVVTFFETRCSQASSKRIVDKKSATLGLPGSREIQIALDADHIELCKFQDCHDDDYEQVVGNILGLAEQVLEDVMEHSKKTGAAVVVAHPGNKIFSLPDLLHRHFTGRAKELRELGLMLEKASLCSKRVAIFGMPGVGKSQMSFKFAHENQHRYTSIFYVQATDREQLLRDFEKIYGLLHLGERSPSEQDQNLKIERIKQWLINNSDWLLVLDNVKHSSIVKEFLPAAGPGAIIFTTRSERMARDLGLAGKLELHPMDESEGVELILKISEFSAPTSEQEFLALELHRELSGLPLALEQVVSSSHRRWLKPVYFKRLQTERVKILKRLPGNELDNSSTCYSVFSLAVRDITPTAVILLKLITHFDHQNLPLSLLYNGQSALIRFLATVDTTHCKEIAQLLQDLFLEEDEIETAVSSLHSSALIRRNEEGIWMHDLFRDFSKDLILGSEKEPLTTSAIILIDSVFPRRTYNPENMSACKILAPHLVISLERAKELALESRILLDAARHLASYLDDVARYPDAFQWFSLLLAGQESFLGKNRPDTLTTVNSIATVLYNQGKYKIALEWYNRALEGRRNSLGKEHPDTLATVNNIAIVLYEQGKYEIALEWYNRVLEGWEKVLGKEHPSTLATVNNIAIVLYDQGKYEMALEWHNRVLEGRRNTLGKGHPDTLGTINNIAVVLYEQGKYEIALEWYNRALEGKEIALGKEHPSTLATVNNIATVLYEQGKYEMALEWYNRVLEGWGKVLGKENPKTLYIASAVSTLQKREGKRKREDQNLGVAPQVVKRGKA